MREIDNDDDNRHQERQGLILTDDLMDDTEMQIIVEDTRTMTIEWMIVVDMGLTVGMKERNVMIHSGIAVDHRTVALMNGVRVDL